MFIWSNFLQETAGTIHPVATTQHLDQTKIFPHDWTCICESHPLGLLKFLHLIFFFLFLLLFSGIFFFFIDFTNFHCKVPVVFFFNLIYPFFQFQLDLNPRGRILVSCKSTFLNLTWSSLHSGTILYCLTHLKAQITDLETLNLVFFCLGILQEHQWQNPPH